MNSVPQKKDILEAAQRIKPYIHKTPILTCNSINRLADAEIYFKCENFQKVGAFKMRGATNAVLSLSKEQQMKGVATHSSGNHAQALALAAKLNNIKAYIVMPENASSVKRDAVAGYGAEIIFCKPTLAAREQALREVVEKTGAVFIPPYNDYRIISGQATCALEMIDEKNDLDYIIAPVGGGGLLSGTLLASKYFSKSIQVYAAEPEGANDAWLSLKNGEITAIDQPFSIADGLLTTVGILTFPIIKEHVKAVFLVSEKEISDAVKLMWERMKIVVEPSGAVPLAALLNNKDKFQSKKVGLIISGGNIDLKSFKFL